MADVVLRASGVSSIEHHLTSFGELLPSVQQGLWDMNVPVWTLGDGFVLRRGNPQALTSYEAVARSDARLGVITAQVQIEAAKSAGVSDDQLVVFKDQPEADHRARMAKYGFTGTEIDGIAAASTRKN